jgi:ribosome maturation factor RimP
LKTTSPIEERVVALIEPSAAELGYRLVRVRVSGLRRKRLQIMAERLSDGLMEIEDCTRLSRRISDLIDENDPIPEEYDLEVSSPGIDRPLMRIEDFERFAGHEAKLETTAMIDGRKRFKGVILGVEAGAVRLKLPDSEIEQVLAFSCLSDARLVLTDRLIEEDLRRSKKLASSKGRESSENETHDEGEFVSLHNHRARNDHRPDRRPGRAQSPPSNGGADKKQKRTKQ